MQRILIYKDQGTHLFGLKSLLFGLQQLEIGSHYTFQWADKKLLISDTWQKNTKLLIFPGGRDIPYHQALKGAGNHSIRKFVKEGGRFLGICAGGYYGSAFIEFEKGGPLEVLEKRELKFFPGVAAGPAYGLQKFCYQSQRGAQIAQLSLFSANTCSFSKSASYYNGGCAFINAQTYSNTTIIARYLDIKHEPAAIVKCQVGKGIAILSGVHPEYSSLYTPTKAMLPPLLFTALEQIELARLSLFKSLFQVLLA